MSEKLTVHVKVLFTQAMKKEASRRTLELALNGKLKEASMGEYVRSLVEADLRRQSKRLAGRD